MRFQVQKWGNSLALRLPKSVTNHFGLSLGSVVEFSIENNRLVLTPISSWRARLKILMNQVEEEQLHQEIDFGPPVGNEFW
jgi:antitoxin MazE